MADLSVIALMKRTTDQIIGGVRESFTEKTRAFLERAQPGYGNLLKNNRRRTSNDPEILGFARLEDGTAVVIQGISKQTQNGTTLPIRIVKLPVDLFDGKAEPTTIDLEPTSFF
jgi:hypothetical protein